jgi:hypothetical protein
MYLSTISPIIYGLKGPKIDKERIQMTEIPKKYLYGRAYLIKRPKRE